MRTINKILNSFSWDSIQDLFWSAFPSSKYHLVLEVVTISSFTAMIEVMFGFKFFTFIAFLIGALIELLSGVYSSVWVKGDSLDSTKLFRWLFKLILLLGGLYMANTFKNEFAESNSLLHDSFQWVYAFIFSIGALEYFISILENYAVAKGKTKDYFTKKMKKKIDTILE
jgi:hypothetical protein